MVKIEPNTVKRKKINHYDNKNADNTSNVDSKRKKGNSRDGTLLCMINT
jgi:hypothetical protein